MCATRPSSVRILLWCGLAALTVSTVGCSKPLPPTDHDGDVVADRDGTDNPAGVGRTLDEQGSEGARLARFRSDHFQGSGICTVCHSWLSDAAGNDVSIGTDWRSTMMSNSARDPYFLASVRAEVEEVPPESRAMVEDTCAKCHMPMARSQAVHDAIAGAISRDGFLDAGNPLHEAAMDGVSCSLCHQISPANLGTPDGFSGEYAIDFVTAEPDRLIYGPYRDMLTDLMRASVGYTPTLGKHITKSSFCSTCHTLFTPVFDSDGKIVGEFPEQASYQEWQHSQFAMDADPVHCQDCHMPLAKGKVAIAALPGGLKGRDSFRRHLFRGGNVFMLRIFRDHIEDLGLTASTENFDATIADALDYLRKDTAELTLVDAAVDDRVLSATLRIDVKTGHKFPTSFPSRRTWIHLAVTDGDGRVVFESGANQDNGQIAGNEADADAMSFEPHYDTITAPNQVQIYETVMQNTDEQVTYTLLRAARYAKDNRLLPLGFDKGTAGADIAVVGGAATDDNFMGGSDRISYKVDLDGADGPFTVSAKLLYQSIGHRFAHAVMQHDGEEVRQFRRFYESAEMAPVVIANATQRVGGG